MTDLWDHQLSECAASPIAEEQAILEAAALRGHIYNTPPRCLHMIGNGGRICLVHSPMGTVMVSDDPSVSSARCWATCCVCTGE